MEALSCERFSRGTRSTRNSQSCPPLPRDSLRGILLVIRALRRAIPLVRAASTPGADVNSASAFFRRLTIPADSRSRLLVIFLSASPATTRNFPTSGSSVSVKTAEIHACESPATIVPDSCAVPIDLSFSSEDPRFLRREMARIATRATSCTESNRGFLVILPSASRRHGQVSYALYVRARDPRKSPRTVHAFDRIKRRLLPSAPRRPGISLRDKTCGISRRPPVLPWGISSSAVFDIARR